MTPYNGIMGRVNSWRWVADNRRRRIGLAIIALILAILVVFPRPYKALATITPADQTSGGLAQAAGNVGAFAGMVGQQQVIDVVLKMARGVQVRGEVVRALKLNDKWGTDEAASMRKLETLVSLRALRGSLLQIEAKTYDRDFSMALAQAYTNALRDKVGDLVRDQTKFKRQVLIDRFADATARRDAAEQAVANFSRKIGMPAPGNALEAAADRLPSLRDQLRDKDSQLEVMRKFQTDENYAVQVALAEREEIKRQIRAAAEPSAAAPRSVDWVIKQRTQYEELARELGYAQSLYDNYKRLIDGTTFEDLVSSGSMRMIEQPYIDPAIQFNTLPALLLAMVLAIAGAFEFGLFDPARGARVRDEDIHVTA